MSSWILGRFSGAGVQESTETPSPAAGPEPQPQPQPQPAATSNDSKIEWPPMLRGGLCADRQEALYSADVVRMVMQTQRSSSTVQRELGRLRAGLGFALGAAGAYAEAASELRSAVRQSEAAELGEGRGVGAHELSQSARARTVARARYGLGLCALARGNPSAALAELRRAAAHDAATAAGGGQELEPQVELALGLALLQCGGHGEEAVERLGSAVRREREWERAKEGVAVLAEALLSVGGRGEEAAARHGHVVEMVRRAPAHHAASFGCGPPCLEVCRTCSCQEVDEEYVRPHARQGGRPSRIAAGQRGLGLGKLREVCGHAGARLRQGSFWLADDGTHT
jgi:tetratricopeptide (TPR) repeat protein